MDPDLIGEDALPRRHLETPGKAWRCRSFAASRVLFVWVVVLSLTACTAETKTVTVSSSQAEPSATPSPADPSNLGATTKTAFPGVAVGSRLSFRVHEVQPKWFREVGPCTVHMYGGRAAFISDCSEVPEDKRLIMVRVSLANQTDEPLRFQVESFLIVAGEQGASYDPVDVRSDWDYNPFLLPLEGLIPPKAKRSGWITFDGRIEDFFGGAGSFEVGSFVYVDGRAPLTIELTGEATSKRV